MPTRREVERLKSQWVKDPVWDLDEVKGFEEHRDELRAFAEGKRREWEETSRERFEAAARQIGLEGNHDLARYVFDLQRRVASLEDTIYDLSAQISRMSRNGDP